MLRAVVCVAFGFWCFSKTRLLNQLHLWILPMLRWLARGELWICSALSRRASMFFRFISDNNISTSSLNVYVSSPPNSRYLFCWSDSTNKVTALATSSTYTGWNFVFEPTIGINGLISIWILSKLVVLRLNFPFSCLAIVLSRFENQCTWTNYHVNINGSIKSLFINKAHD